EIRANGGLFTVFSFVTENLAAHWQQEFNVIIESPAYVRGIGYNGKPYVLSSAEVSTAKTIASQYFVELEKALHKAELNSLQIKATLPRHPLVDERAEPYLTRAQKYVFEKAETVID